MADHNVSLAERFHCKLCTAVDLSVYLSVQDIMYCVYDLWFSRYVVSSLPYFTWVMIAVTIAALCTQISEIFITSVDVSSADASSDMPFYIWWMDLIFVVFTLFELILKVRVPPSPHNLDPL